MLEEGGESFSNVTVSSDHQPFSIPFYSGLEANTEFEFTNKTKKNSQQNSRYFKLILYNSNNKITVYRFQIFPLTIG